jgi:uncharacterized protein YbjT (DUF2867 family)
MTHITVLVTGATGRTGQWVVRRLRQLPSEFTVRGFARSAAKVVDLFGSTDHFWFGDIAQPANLAAALHNCQALVILTSAIPRLIAPQSPGERPQFCFDPGQMPEVVDYQGQINQIEAAQRAGVKQIVLVGSMGGTNEQHPLNQIGAGQILIWKRKAEQHLIESGLDYTIIRAGGLQDVTGGQRQLLVGQNDRFLRQSPDGVPTTVPRADVAEVVVQALRHRTARNKAFDLIARPEGQGEVTQDFAALFAQTKGGL